MSRSSKTGDGRASYRFGMSTQTSSTPASVDSVRILDDVLHKTADLLTGVRDDQWHDPTPCPGWDVTRLADHMVSWVRVFAAGLAGEPRDADPEAYVSTDRAGDFRAAADKAVEGVRRLGLDRGVTLFSGSLPGAAVLAMAVGEYVAHGWDLATATGQPVPYTDEEASLSQEGLAPMLLDEYRGPDKPFGYAVPTPDDAPALVRMLRFSGRDAS
jgi:uncharacterized protein (TIGR03086 family)